MACPPAITYVIARLRYQVSFLAHHLNPPFEVFLIQESLTMALPPAEKKEPMEGKFILRESSDKC